MSIVVHVG